MTTGLLPGIREGDEIGVFLPSSPVREPYLGKGREVLRSQGLRVRLLDGSGPAESPWYAREAGELKGALEEGIADPDLRMLVPGRGGFGAWRLLDWCGWQRDVVGTHLWQGASDASLILWAIQAHHPRIAFYGPMPFSTWAEADIEQWWGVMAAHEVAPFQGQWGICPGTISAPLAGGCLSLLSSVVGTPFCPVLRGHIVLLEDLGERPHRFLRHVWQLKSSGVLREVAGLMLNGFPGTFLNRAEEESFWRELRDMLSPLGIPVSGGFPLGHGPGVQTFPLGVPAELKVSDGVGLCRLLEPAVLRRKA